MARKVLKVGDKVVIKENALSSDLDWGSLREGDIGTIVRKVKRGYHVSSPHLTLEVQWEKGFVWWIASGAAVEFCEEVLQRINQNKINIKVRTMFERQPYYRNKIEY